MQRKVRPTESVATLCAAQGGVVARAQLLGLGVTRTVLTRLLADGVLSVVEPGIYARAPEITWRGRAWMGILVGGPASVLGHEAAAFLFRLSREEPSTITVFTRRQVAFRPGFEFIRGDRAGTGEPPRTSREATLLDLCSRSDSDGIAALLADAVSSRRVTAKGMLAELRRRGRQRHSRLIREVLGDVGVGAHSALERRYLLDVERAHGLPVATRQVRAAGSHRSDAWYEKFALVVELDGKLHHSGGAAFHDMTRDNHHALRGITTFRFGWEHIADTPCQTARLVGVALMQRGWPGPVGVCTHCRAAWDSV